MAGRLQCERPLAPNSDNIPAGTYTQSCNGCNLNENVLSCTQCRSGDGSLHSSEVSITGCSSIENKEGLLFCVPDPQKGAEEVVAIAVEHEEEKHEEEIHEEEEEKHEHREL